MTQPLISVKNLTIQFRTDEGLVTAQETRRVLDRLVGYVVSPLLWKKVKPALSEVPRLLIVNSSPPVVMRLFGMKETPPGLESMNNRIELPASSGCPCTLPATKTDNSAPSSTVWMAASVLFAPQLLVIVWTDCWV